MELTRFVVLAAICALAYLAGEGLARVHIPRLPVYLAVGAISGLLITSAVETANVAFPIIDDVTLSVIGFIAGSHLVWHSIKPRLKPILIQATSMTVLVPLFVGSFVFLALPSVPTEVRLAAAILAGTVMLALSPAEAVAVITEAKSVGPFTKLVIGTTMLMDVVVVAAFSVALTTAKALVYGGGSVAELVATVAAGLVLAVVGGLITGILLKPVIERVSSRALTVTLVLALSGLTVWLATNFKHFAEARWGLEVEIEALLVAMIAGLWVANRSAHPEKFALILERMSPWIYAIFFTLTGLGLHLEALIAAAVPATLLWLLRLGGLWGSSAGAMALAKEPALVRKVAWRAFVPQAGIALALAATIAAEFPKAGVQFSTLIIGVVVLNEATGPFFLRSALRATGETVPEGEMLD